MRVVDLSWPIKTGHLRWAAEISVKGDLSRGDLFQVTTLKVPCHAFTHVDARRHFFQDGDTIEATPLDAVVGDCAVIDLLDVAPNEALTPARIAPRAAHLTRGGMALFKTGWDRHRSIETADFWLDAPYLTRESAQWLLDAGIKSVAFDFPQDYVIRLLLSGEIRPLPEHVTHDVLLRNGVNMIEYVCNTSALREPRVLLSAAPLKIVGGDGAPARVYAIEGR